MQYDFTLNLRRRQVRRTKSRRLPCLKVHLQPSILFGELILIPLTG